jgi:hypothetical protein
MLIGVVGLLRAFAAWMLPKKHPATLAELEAGFTVKPIAAKNDSTPAFEVDSNVWRLGVWRATVRGRFDNRARAIDQDQKSVGW